jgi:hypothetical protein
MLSLASCFNISERGGEIEMIMKTRKELATHHIVNRKNPRPPSQLPAPPISIASIHHLYYVPFLEAELARLSGRERVQGAYTRYDGAFGDGGCRRVRAYIDAPTYQRGSLFKERSEEAGTYR